VNDIGLDHQILIDEFCRIGVVGENSANLCCGQVNLIHAFAFKELSDIRLLNEVKFRPCARDEVGVAGLPQLPHDTRTNHSAVAGNEDSILSRHHVLSRRAPTPASATTDLAQACLHYD